MYVDDLPFDKKHVIHKHNRHVIVAGYRYRVEQRDDDGRGHVLPAVLHQQTVLEVTEQDDGQSQPSAGSVFDRPMTGRDDVHASFVAVAFGLQRPFHAAQRVLDVPQSDPKHGRQQRADCTDCVRRQRVHAIAGPVVVVVHPHRPDLVERQVQLYDDYAVEQHDRYVVFDLPIATEMSCRTLNNTDIILSSWYYTYMTLFVNVLRIIFFERQKKKYASDKIRSKLVPNVKSGASFFAVRKLNVLCAGRSGN